MQNETQIQATEGKQMTFEDFGFKKDLLRAIDYAGFKVPSPIQAEAIPLVMQGRDIVGQAHTGTGKTAAFGLPALNAMRMKSGVEVLVITPTRELATQVSDELFKYGRNLGVNTVTIYGGSSYNRQLDLIKRGAGVVVATPGRLLDLLKRDMLDNFAPKIVILDEADEMLDMGFLDDINEIFSYLPTDRQTLLFSATMPAPIKVLAERILQNPAFVSITKGETTNKDIKQEYYVIEESERDAAIIRLMEAEEMDKAIVFCRTKREVDRLANVLSAAGFMANGLHGDMEQRQRETVIKAVKAGNVQVLVATDVAARGIHVNDISHVFNYHIPFDPESYVHRIGRTGRAGRVGKAITLLTPLEFKELQRIKAKVGTTMEHAYVPSKSDMKTSSIATLVASIEEQNIYDEAHIILDQLKQDIDEETMLFKMISMLLEKQSIQGPNNIGIPAERLEGILARINRTDKGSNKNRGGNRRGGFKGNRFGGDRGRSNDRNRSGERRPGKDRNRSREPRA
ncbi:DEAD/DEAH box helicase [Sulfurimonas sp. HSL-1716]|uniref:DEAD/DEAH box helicase n=1 Tax=Hydrocurvibacter sulfurireducens TaxID=3131937 RepID=UPI0031F93E10